MKTLLVGHMYQVVGDVAMIGPPLQIGDKYVCKERLGGEHDMYRLEPIVKPKRMKRADRLLLSLADRTPGDIIVCDEDLQSFKKVK